MPLFFSEQDVPSALISTVLPVNQDQVPVVQFDPDSVVMRFPVQSPQLPDDPYLHLPLNELQSSDSVNSTSPASFGGLYVGASDHVPVNLLPDTVP